MTAIARVLEEAGYGTYLPHRDGVERYVMGLVNSPLNVNLFNIRKLIDRAIFCLDVYQLVKCCDYLVLNMNGRVPDEGALIETAMAYAVGKPIVVYKNDVRTAFNGMDNSMITGLVQTKKIRDIKKLPRELERVSAQLSKKRPRPLRPSELPPTVQADVRFGAKVWGLLQRFNRGEQEPSDLVDEIARLCVEQSGEEERCQQPTAKSQS